MFVAKTQDFAEAERRLASHELVNLNETGSPDRLLPVLQLVTESDQRRVAADRIESYLDEHRPVPNVGVLARLRVPSPTAGAKPATLPLVPLAKIKPLLVVRNAATVPDRLLAVVPALFGRVRAVHFAWRRLKFRGDPLILPALHVLTGFGLVLMISLRDPLRDTLDSSASLGV